MAGFLFLYLSIAASLVLWFHTAPAYRFAYALLFSVPFMAIAILIAIGEKFIANAKTKLALFSAIMILTMYYFETHKTIRDTLKVARQRIFHDNPGYLLKPAPSPGVALFYKKLNSMRIHYPKSGPQCWESPPPCIQERQFTFKSRGPDIKSGFR